MAEQPASPHRVPPHSPDAEMAVLGAMLLDNEAISLAAEQLDEDSFYSRANQHVFDLVCQLFDELKQIDIVILREELKKRDLLDKVGGASYLMALFDAVPTAANVEYYIDIVKEKASRRALIKASTAIIQESYDDSQELETLLDSAERQVFAVTEAQASSEASQISQILKKTFDQIDGMDRDQGQVSGLPTGFYDLDELTSGLQNSELLICAARPSIGKTTICLNICEHVAVVERKPCLLFSLEMAAGQVAQNMLCSHAQIDAHRMRRGMLADSEWADLTLAVGTLSEAPIFIDDSPGLTLREVRARSRRMVSRAQIRLIVIDYLQLMEAPHKRRDGREQEISEISRGLKSLARELEVPVLAVAQLNRGVESREGHRPRMSDLRESGAIEQDADVVMLLHRDEYYDPDLNPGLGELIVAKQRNGPTGKVDLVFRKEFMRFGNLSEQEAP